MPTRCHPRWCARDPSPNRGRAVDHISGARAVRDVGEAGLVELLAKRFPAIGTTVGIGDDAAVLDPPAGSCVVTTDAMVEGVDFDLAYSAGDDLGWKVVAINVSDVAAMGAVASHAVVTMCLPPETPVLLVEGVVDGIEMAAREWSIQIVGGDLSGAPLITLGASVIGSVDAPVLRSGARAGDAICITGSLGGSASGLALLQRDSHATGPLVRRHLRPHARAVEGALLRELGATAMIDVSDGFLVDLSRLVVASGTGCDVDPGSVPIDPAIAGQGEGLEAALFGGEDYELLFTIAASDLAAAVAQLGDLGTNVTQVGVVTDGDRRVGDRDLDELKEEGWDHLRGR